MYSDMPISSYMSLNNILLTYISFTYRFLIIKIYILVSFFLQRARVIFFKLEIFEINFRFLLSNFIYKTVNVQILLQKLNSINIT